MPKGREERTTARATHEEAATVGTPGTMIKEHSQQQADKCAVLLKVVKSVTTTQCDQAAAGADVPEDVPQGVKTDPQSEECG